MRTSSAATPAGRLAAVDLVDLLDQRAGAHPERPLYTFLTDGETPAEPWTYGDLERKARALGAALVAHQFYTLLKVHELNGVFVAAPRLVAWPGGRAHGPRGPGAVPVSRSDLEWSIADTQRLCSRHRLQ